MKEKDKTIAHLRNDLALLRGESVKPETVEDVLPSSSNRKLRLPPRAHKRSSVSDDVYAHGLEVGNSIYFGNPGMNNVVHEVGLPLVVLTLLKSLQFSHLSVDHRPSSLSHAVPRGMDVSAFQMATSHPFPTLWSAKDDTSTLVKLLPSEADLFFYLDAFQRRAQSCSFPHLPEECTSNEVRRFLDNVEHNAALHPDMLALLFATLAQGLQNGVYDKYDGKWIPGTVEAELKKGDVYSKYQIPKRDANLLSQPSCCCHAMS